MLARRNQADGQSLVEFALVLPVFLLIFIGLIDLGRFVLADSILSQGAREGARLAAVEASWLGSSDPSCGSPGGPTCPANVAALVSDVTTAGNRMVAGLGGTITTVHLSCDPPGLQPTGAWTGVSCTNNAQGNVLSVRVEFVYSPLTPIVNSITGSVARSGAASMVIN
ncbi:MAG TPA: TadE family protein [Candidatus Limnocylindrales bacterium]